MPAADQIILCLWAAVKQLREELRDARLLTLGAFEEVAQASSLVLLKGSLRTSGQAFAHLPPSRSASGNGLQAEARPDEAPGDARPQQQGDWHIKVCPPCSWHC